MHCDNYSVVSVGEFSGAEVSGAQNES